jgi:peptide-methionine (R)-S-oxide reductase
MKRSILFLALAFLLQACSYSQNSKPKTMESSNKNNPVYSNTDSSAINLSNDEWKKILPDDVYHIARMKGTERPWTSQFEGFKEKGTYYCAACGNPLFISDTKF